MMSLEVSRRDRFLKVFFHPGTWVFFGLVAVGLAMAFPPVAISLLIFAAIAMAVAAVCTYVYLLENQAKITERALSEDDYSRGREQSPLKQFKYWLKNHKVQAAIVALGILAAIALTVGFIATGGAGFAFMAPLMAALTTTFAPATAAGATVLAAATVILAAFNITNLLKRFAAWLNSFKTDFAAYKDNQDDNPWKGERWETWSRGHVKRLNRENKVDKDLTGLEALTANAKASFADTSFIFQGMWACVKQGFHSVHEDKLAGYVPPKPGGSNSGK